MSFPALSARALRVCSCTSFVNYGRGIFQVLSLQSVISSTSSWSGLRFYRTSPARLAATSRHLVRAGAMGGKGSKGGGGEQQQESRETQAASGTSAEQTAVEAGKEQVTEKETAGTEYMECTVAKVSDFGANE